MSNTVYVVGEMDGDDSCGGLIVLGIFDTIEAAEARKAFVKKDNYWAEVFEIPLNSPGTLGYYNTQFEQGE